MSFSLPCLLFLLCTTAFAATGKANCRNGEANLEGHCVSLLAPTDGALSYADAVSTCRAHGDGYNLAKI